VSIAALYLRESNMNIRVTGALAAAALLTFVSHAQAQSLPPEGELHVTFTATQAPAVNPMTIGEGKQYLQVNYIMSASNDQGNAVLNNMGGRCQLNRLVDGSAKTTETHGYCAYTDADNDQIFEKCDFLPGQPNTCVLTGGTGKFQGLQASVIITSVAVKSTYEGTQQIVGHKNGTYKIVKTN
jgi:hypothetical protein